MNTYLEELKKGDVDITPVDKVNPIILIAKTVGKKKDAFLLTLAQGVNSVPSFLQKNVVLSNDTDENKTFVLNCIEGKETVSVTKQCNNIVIAYEELTPDVANGKVPQAPDGKYYNVWWKKNAKETLIYKDGVFYENPQTMQAQLCTKEFPSFLGNVTNSLKRVDNGWLYKVSWQPNPLFAEDNKGYWVKYGEDDFNYLNVNTESAIAYNVVDMQGNRKMNLVDYYKQTH